ncbi:MAG TPA: DUF4912 domain-containing protein [Pyrinomonadaceae bacterium]
MQEFDETAELDEITFDIDATSGASSATVVMPRAGSTAVEKASIKAGRTDEVSSVFSELANPTLPELPREARARLLMQSPTRLYFYWSTGANPYLPLDKALGNGSAYRLALRLLDLTHGSEELHAVEQEGSWWFDVRPHTEYRAEIGFYSPSRPFIRILFSNTIGTPRKGPSPHRSSEARWVISAGKFADILEASGFTSDAGEITRGEETGGFTDRLARLVGVAPGQLAEFNIADVRQAIEGLAAGTPIVDFKWKISAELYALLEEHLGKLSASALRENFDIDAIADDADETMAAIGGSLVNIRKARYTPVSSLSLP